MVKLIYNGPGVRAFGRQMVAGDTGEYDEASAALLLRHPEFSIVAEEPPPAVQLSAHDEVPIVEPEAAPKPKAKWIGKRAAKGKVK